MWLRTIKPFWPREKLYWWFLHGRAMPEGWFRGVPLEFCPAARLDLCGGCVSHRQIAMLGYLDRGFSRRLVGMAGERGGLLVDVGANWGYFSCLWAAASPRARGVAFEPSPRNVPGLRRNVERNGLADRVRVRPVAVGRQAGETRFDLGPEGQTGWGGLAAEGSAGDIVVEATTLDAEFGGSGEEIEVLKIDTEGADFWVIEGAEGLLRGGRIRHIFFEANRARMGVLGVDGGRALELLGECGYGLEGSGDGWHAYLGRGARRGGVMVQGAKFPA